MILNAIYVFFPLEIDIDSKFDSPEQELFIYSVLLGRPEMTKLFCSQGSNAVCSALVAKTIFTTYSKLFEENSLKFKNLAREYEQLAHDILNAYYVKDEEKSKLTLLRKVKEYDNCTTIQVAVASNSLSIMAHQCFQNVLNNIWFSKLYHDLSYFNLAISIFCPLIAPFVLDFQKEQILPVKSDEEDLVSEMELDDFENE